MGHIIRTTEKDAERRVLVVLCLAELEVKASPSRTMS